MKLSNIISVLYQGSQVADPAKWKGRQTALSLTTSVLSGAAFFALQAGWIPVLIPEELIMQVSAGLVSLSTLAIAYLTPATSVKAGFKPRVPPPDDGNRYEPLGNFGHGL